MHIRLSVTSVRDEKQPMNVINMHPGTKLYDSISAKCYILRFYCVPDTIKPRGTPSLRINVLNFKLLPF